MVENPIEAKNNLSNSNTIVAKLYGLLLKSKFFEVFFVIKFLLFNHPLSPFPQSTDKPM